MTKFQLNRSDAPWDYPSLGFRANTNDAILDGSLSTPAITTPPDAYWSVYEGASAETVITRYSNPTGPNPATETPEGYILAYSDTANRFTPMAPADYLEVPSVAGALSATIAGAIDAQVPPLVAAGVAAFAPTADVLALRRLDDLGTQATRRYAGQAVIDAADSTLTVVDWSSLTGIVNNRVQVSGNKLYGQDSTLTNPCVAYIPLPSAIAAGAKFHASTFLDRPAGTDAGPACFFGISTVSPTDTGYPSAQPDDISIGITGTGRVQCIAGANVTASITEPADTAAGVVSEGRYYFSIDGDEESVSFAIRHTTDNTRVWTWNFPTTVLATLGRSIGRIMVYMADGRGTAWHGFGPVVVSQGSQQPSRTKTVGGFKVESIAHRDVSRVATSGDKWRYQLPSGYDPRKPAPLAIYLHQAGSSIATEDRPWTNANEQPLTKALGDAGYIVAAAQDGFVVGNANTDRYGNAAAMANYTALYEFIRSHFAISSVVLYGPSMAGLTGSNILARRTIPNIAAAYFINPSIDLDVPFANPTYQAPIRAAFGIASDNSDYDAKTTGYNSMDRAGWEFRGVPVRMVAASGDTIAPPASHVDPWIAKLAPYSSEASKLTVAGGHLPSVAFDAADLMSFLGRHVR